MALVLPPAATAPIRPLAWKPPYAMGAAQEMAKKRQKKILFLIKRERIDICIYYDRVTFGTAEIITAL